ncbi:hypothetical protein T484DRAFT_3631664, partial [Baffinella frigidus]
RIARHATLPPSRYTLTTHSRHFASLPRFPRRAHLYRYMSSNNHLASGHSEVLPLSFNAMEMPLFATHAAALEHQSPPHTPIAAEAEDAEAGPLWTPEDSDSWSNADTELCEELQREQIHEEVMLNNGIPTDEHLQRLGHLRHNARDVSHTEPLMSSFGPEPPAAASSSSDDETWRRLRLLEWVARLGEMPIDDATLCHIACLRAQKPRSLATPKMHSAF